MRFFSAIFVVFLILGIFEAAPSKKCPENEEFKECGTACEANCFQGTIMFCTLQCIVNVCQCKPGFYRNADKNIKFLLRMKVADTSENVFTRSLSITSRTVTTNAGFVRNAFAKIRPYLGFSAFVLFLLIYHGYLIAAGIHNYQKAAPLIYVTVFLWACFALNLVTKTPIFKHYYSILEQILTNFANQRRFIPISIRIAIILGLIAYTIVTCRNEWSRLSGLFGYVFFIIFMILISNNRTKINFSIVSNAFIFHYVLAIIILQWSTGQWFFQQLAQLIVGLLEFAQVGAKFVFGFIADPPNICDLRPVFIFTSLQTLIYFGAIVSLLFHFGIIQSTLSKTRWFMKVLIGTTAVESVNAWACTFLGMSEGPLLIAPYADKLTDSEMFAVVTSGFACVAGTVFAAYIALGACPIYLLTSSLLSAPCSLGCSKLMYPETEETKINDDGFELKHENDNKSVIDCICSGGVSLIPVVSTIGACLVVIMSLLALLDNIMYYIGDLIGFEGWSFQMLFGYVFFPLAFMMGVNYDVHQTLLVAQLMGTKTAVNEFVAYDTLGKLQANNELLPKSVLIATYAICGFANFASMGMQIEFLGAIAPKKKQFISRTVFQSLIAGSIATFLNATIAGILVENPIICKPPSSNSTCFRIPS
ncbi:unnamed protein product [Caenorhabditis bovis]|uniref:Sodium/nucleoside cotransporter n=1 Tax=Caenorhabditis bovis TaxID=2654633 RepID=A0A8S1ED72_9PELO|nr:unnamed protein product [Caenorhabditis bovis]